MNYQRLKNQLIKHEGVRLKPYLCTAQKLTIGVGRNIEDKGITENEAMYLLENDINECIADCRKLFPGWEQLTENRKIALLDMRFNLGPTRFRGFRRMIAAIKDGDFKRATTEMEDSVWFRQVGNRAVTLRKMME